VSPVTFSYTFQGQGDPARVGRRRKRNIDLFKRLRDYDRFHFFQALDEFLGKGGFTGLVTKTLDKGLGFFDFLLLGTVTLKKALQFNFPGFLVGAVVSHIAFAVPLKYFKDLVYCLV